VLLVRGFPGPVAYKEQPGSEYLDSNYGAILSDPGDKRKAAHKGSQSTFPPFYRKGLIRVRGSLKAPLVTQGIL
jgi:hypothetical protein